MRALDLFSGIGGFSLGLERAGMETVAFCEVDAFCRQVLAKHWPNVRIHDDVRTLDGNQYRGTVDVVCGGFPCQPFSVAGKRDGKDDDRHLWPEMLRIIREVQPRYVIGENVAGFVNMELDNCLSDLEAIGYACGAFVIPACAVDAQHRRDRVWILAYRDGDSESGSTVNAEARGMQEADVGNANSALEQGGRLSSGVHPQEPIPYSRSYEGGRPAPCEWKPEPGVGRVVDGVPRRMDRLKALGNAVVPQVVEQIGLAIMGEQ
jgi:DNA (cytosine-5)-methyltransferase 1